MSGNILNSNPNDFQNPLEDNPDEFRKDTSRCKNCLWRTWDSFAWNRIKDTVRSFNMFH